jgi:hypothetical protein
VDVRVQFRGGWLSEYYPDAVAEAPGFAWDRGSFGAIKSTTTGSLQWRNLQVGSEARGPETDYRVWLAPREVKAAGVRTDAGEAESYLFYRGVGHVEAPLRVYRDAAEGKLVVSERFTPAMLGSSAARPLTTLWLADIRKDGAVAFHEVPQVQLTGEEDRTVATFTSKFGPEDYSRDNLAELRSTMKRSLLADGLFPDEAEAMLNTWEYGYFKSPGLRLFFMLPRSWTDAVLPLELSQEADVVRTMVGRIELVTPEHRRLLEHMAQTPLSSTDWYGAIRNRESGAIDYQKLWEGRVRLSDLDVELPPEYRDYLALGRFRNALVLDAIEQKPNEGLRKFAGAYRLQYYDRGE